MNQAQRIALIVGAVVVLGAGFVIAQDGDEADTPTVTPQPTTTAQTGPTATTTATTPTTPKPKPKPAAPVVVVQGGRPDGGVKQLRFDKGDQATFTVRSDVADEVHVHGYDLMEDVKAGGTARFSFEADIDGIFEIELEGAGVQIAELRVDP